MSSIAHTFSDCRPRLIEFSELGDERGHLCVIDGVKTIPFNPKRVFYIYGSEANVIRGQHANRETEFVLINVAGSSKVKILDGLDYEEEFVLDRPRVGIYIPKMYWKDMYDFSEDSILLVLASEHYDGGEYIRDYDAFIKEIKGNE